MKITMNNTRKAVLSVLENATKPMTLVEISTAVGFEVKTGSTNAMVTAGLIDKAGEAEITKMAKSTVATYALGSKTPEQVEKFTMNETRKAVLDTLANATEPMTLAEISAVAGVTVKSGTTNTMVAKDLIVKAGDKIILKPVKAKVATYVIGSVKADAAGEAAKA